MWRTWTAYIQANLEYGLKQGLFVQYLMEGSTTFIEPDKLLTSFQ
jgi:hypothetical protein